MKNRSIAVLGAGLAGLACAHRLAQRGYAVQVFDKARSVAGRMSVRRLSSDVSAEVQFDHGAQYFTARTPEFLQQVQQWISQGIVAEWSGPFVSLQRGNSEPAPGMGDPRYVGVPGMNALCKTLASDLSVRCGTRIKQLERTPAGWQLTAEFAERPEAETIKETFPQKYSAMVCTFPAPQAVELLPEQVSFRSQLETVRLAPCRCLLLQFATPLAVDFAAAFVQDSPLRWIARENSKPGRRAREEYWVLHASPEWSQFTFEQNEAGAGVIPELLKALAEAIAAPLPEIMQLSSHRWRYAIPENPLNVGCLIDPELQIVAAGDWCTESRVEGAYLSGLKAADAVEQMLA